MTDAYLRDLERAVRDLPKPIAADIVGGVREELRGLDAAAAAERIAELGDPEFIAAAARAEVPPKRHDAGWYSVVTVVLVAIGGVLVPVLGWFVGIAMLWWSRTWTLRDKLVGTLLLPVAAGLALGIAALAGTTTQTAGPGYETINPLIPRVVSLSHSAIIVVALVVPIVSAIYLAIRASRLRSIQQP